MEPPKSDDFIKILIANKISLPKFDSPPRSIRIQESQTQFDPTKGSIIRLSNLTYSSSGNYKCEVTTEPCFETAEKKRMLTVTASSKFDELGALTRANCTVQERTKQPNPPLILSFLVFLCLSIILCFGRTFPINISNAPELVCFRPRTQGKKGYFDRFGLSGGRSRTAISSPYWMISFLLLYARLLPAASNVT